MKSIINKYDYMSGKLLQQYSSITEAAKDNNLTYVAVMKQLQQDVLKYPRRDYYFGYKPKKRWIIVCYDNETRYELGRYKNLQELQNLWCIYIDDTRYADAAFEDAFHILLFDVQECEEVNE